LADNIAYDVESYMAGRRVESAWDETLRRRKGVCQGYATLLTEMCHAAGIRCEKIGGYGRGYRFGLGRSQNLSDANHAWNAVRIGGGWYLLDVTWDAGHVEPKAYHKQYGTAYLFLEPKEFLYTHFPTDSKWQLLARPYNARQFVNLPYLRGRFFEHGLRLATRLGRITRAGESVRFTVEAPPGVDLFATLKDGNGAALPRRTLVQREGGRCRVLVTFPRAGRWKVHLHSKLRRQQGPMLLAASLEFETSSGTGNTFPETFGAYNRMDGCLLSPLFVPLAAGRPVPFKIRVRGASRVSLLIGEKQWQKLDPHPADKDVYQLTATVPRGLPVKLMAKGPADKSHWTLVDFTPESK